MKKIFSLCLTLLFFAPSLWASSSGGITVHLTNGQSVSFLFSQHPKLTTTSKELSILINDVKQVSYNYAEVKKVEVSNSLPTEVKLPQLKKEGIAFNFGDGQIRVSGLTSNEVVTAYSAEGTTVLSRHATANGTLTIDVSQLPQGVCIIRTQSGVNYKFYNNN